MNERVELDPRPEGCYWGLTNLLVPVLCLSLPSGVYSAIQIQGLCLKFVPWFVELKTNFRQNR